MHLSRHAVLPLLAVAALAFTVPQASGYPAGIVPPQSPSLPAMSPTAAAVAANQAVRFEPNRGQAPDGVRYVARGSGRALVFDDTSLALRAGDEIVRIDFAAAGAQPRTTLTNATPGVSNYLLDSDSRTWVTGVERYARLRYEGAANGVDVDFYAAGAGHELEFDFIVAPGADVSAVALHVQGATDVALDDSGALQITAGEEPITLQAPIAYQQINGRRVAVESSFRLLDDGGVGFAVGAYDRAGELVIDPVLVYSTYLGGAGYAGSIGDYGQGIDSDAAGNAYVVGFTDSASFPTTPGSYQPLCAGTDCRDGFITKLDPSGTLLFSTFIGGPLSDGLQGVEVSETTGVINFVGAGSAGFPLTAGAFQSVYAGGGDLVAGALDPSGTVLLASTFLGGSLTEGTVDIAVDAAGYMYVTGQTSSCDLPTTAGSFQPVDPMCGLFDAFVAKISPDATSADYVTYLGGASGSDVGFGIDVDATGHAYVVGFAGSTDFPTTAGSLQPVWPGGFNSAWVTKLLPDGSGLAYSTFLGGSNSEEARSVAVDAAGNAYVVGSTSSPDFPTVAPWQPVLAGPGDAYVAVLDPSGATLLSSTYLGGTDFDGAVRMQLEGPGVVWVIGATSSTDFPVVDALQAANAGDNDAFVARFETATPALTFSTYLGGSLNDFGRDIAVTAAGVVGTGFTSSGDFPTVNALQPAYGGGMFDAFAFRIGAGAGATEVTVSAPSAVNPRSRGVIPVAILTTDSFDATTVDPASATFGPSMASIAHGGHIGDVDGDGDADLQLHFAARDTGIACGDTEATLAAETFGGTAVSATVPIRTVGCH
ncbi:MAG: SBBP repeat-containing protein [Acidobacteriota bacterium]|jgi:hypothetical protein